MVEITLKEAEEVLRQLEKDHDLPLERRAALIQAQYRIIVRLLIQKAYDHDKALEKLFGERRGFA